MLNRYLSSKIDGTIEVVDVFMASNCASGARWCKDGDDPGQQPADPSRQAAAHHWRGNEVSGRC